jgi:hypothetical protein
MKKLFSIAFWNLEHFNRDDKRTRAALRLVRDQHADVFSVCEINNRIICAELVEEMPDYQFMISSAPQTQELFVGAKKTFNFYFSERVHYHLAGIQLSLPECIVLFLRTKQGLESVELGPRRDIFRRAMEYMNWCEKSIHDDSVPFPPKFIFLGSLNARGDSNPLGREIDPAVELEKLDKKAKQLHLKRLTKNSHFTWWKGQDSTKSDLDHVIASEDLAFCKFIEADIDVRGWPKLDTESHQIQWIRKYSEHGILYFEVEER